MFISPRFLNRSLLFAVTVLPLSAGVIYQQPSLYVPPNGADNGFAWTSVYSPTDGGFQTFDNFAVSANSMVNLVQWTGFSRDFITPANNPVLPGAVTWDLSFSADNSGAPGAVLYDMQELAASVTATQLGTTVRAAQTVYVYQFTAFLPTSFSAAANTTYWFSALSLQPSANPLFVWLDGSGGDGSSYQNALNPDGSVSESFVRSSDRAFTLLSTPEPDPAYLFAAPLLAILGWNRFRRKARHESPVA
jgi:hypothetical protein